MSWNGSALSTRIRYMLIFDAATSMHFWRGGLFSQGPAMLLLSDGSLQMFGSEDAPDPAILPPSRAPNSKCRRSGKHQHAREARCLGSLPCPVLQRKRPPSRPCVTICQVIVSRRSTYSTYRIPDPSIWVGLRPPIRHVKRDSRCHQRQRLVSPRSITASTSV